MNNIIIAKITAKGKTYKEKQEDVRRQAIEWQKYCEEQDYCWGDLIMYQECFENLAKRYGLIKEFKENGII